MASQPERQPSSLTLNPNPDPNFFLTLILTLTFQRHQPVPLLPGSLHKFLAQLVETANSIQGRTVLYIPEEDVEDPELAAKDKVKTEIASQPSRKMAESN